MRQLSKLAGLLGVAGLATVMIGSSATPSDAKSEETSFRCKAKATGHIVLRGRYEERVRKAGVRKKFIAEFDARRHGAFAAGQQLIIMVDEVEVGTLTLTKGPGEISGELKFDTKPGPHEQAFPDSFPAVKTGTMIEATSDGATVLGCELH